MLATTSCEGGDAATKVDNMLVPRARAQVRRSQLSLGLFITNSIDYFEGRRERASLREPRSPKTQDTTRLRTRFPCLFT